MGTDGISGPVGWDNSVNPAEALVPLQSRLSDVLGIPLMAGTQIKREVVIATPRQRSAGLQQLSSAELEELFALGAGEYLPFDAQQQWNFVIFVPASSRRPLVLPPTSSNTRGVETAAAVPSHGGILLLNDPEKWFKGVPLKEVLPAIAEQYRSLLGLPPVSMLGSNNVTWRHSENDQGISHVEQMLVCETRVALSTWRGTSVQLLTQLRTLADESDVVVGPEVALNAATAVDFLSMAEIIQPCSTRMQYLAEAQLAAQAAIKHPSLLPRAHIPQIHKVAVFMPFLLPLISAVTGTFFREARRRARECPA